MAHLPLCILKDFKQQQMHGDGIAQALCWPISPLLIYKREIGTDRQMVHMNGQLEEKAIILHVPMIDLDFC